MPNKHFSNAIRMIRENNNITMQELADKLGVTKGAVNMWENKGVVPREDILMNISKEYCVSIDKLLGNEINVPFESNNKKLSYLQRNLGNLNDKQLEQAEQVLKAVFNDLFDDEEGDDNDDI